ncbi:serine hydrolase domain-containing protein [Nocardiopsis sp. CT-R113]|uniref:Serine hydrolase domain-containing protein n=1 Tax=Nocardiopsis codii TaxID=3065942 RepID=A0ABU7K3I8_9ACTN|nr:serine hydrolase domain-containing protein [Nocardiopsis sp. CT-R113]MEE2036818.1 serine hydrolase domain-containing protein [Nocardiopsis sp. CT-R113]
MRSGPATRTVVAACAVAALVLVLGVAARPQVPSLSGQESGDPGLLDRARPLLAADARERASVVEIDGDLTRVAHFGADGGTVYEIGSVTKAMTSLLLADAVERGEVTEDTELGTLLDLGDAPAASVTLAELAGHRSGLPRLPAGFSSTFGMAVANYRGSDPYQADLDTLVEQVAAAELSGRGEVAYSNMGTAVLGHAVAAATGADYASLLRERLLDPVGMDATTLPVTPDNLPEDASVGHGPQGRTADPWTSHAYAPMGGVRSTPDDMELLARALLEGDAPGSDAMEPRHDAGGGTEVGLGWWIDVHGETTVTWHNGGTGGFSSMFALDREGGRAVIVLADSTMAVDDVANTLLLEEA